jgi:hypothetical protein
MVSWRGIFKRTFYKGLSSPAPPFILSDYSFPPDATHVEMTGRLLSLFSGRLQSFHYFIWSKGDRSKRGYPFSAFLFLPSLPGYLFRNAPYRSYLLGTADSIRLFLLDRTQERESVEDNVVRIFLGLAYLTRPEGIGYVLVYLMWIIVEGILKGWFKRLLS